MEILLAHQMFVPNRHWISASTMHKVCVCKLYRVAASFPLVSPTQVVSAFFVVSALFVVSILVSVQ